MYLIFFGRKRQPLSETGALSYSPLSAARPKRPIKKGSPKEYRAWTCETEIDCYLFFAESTD
jgi:hypothetical protein